MSFEAILRQPVAGIGRIFDDMNDDWGALGRQLQDRIEGIYAQSGVVLPIDPEDQQRFLISLYSIVKRLRLGRVIQTGTFMGYSSVAMALAMADGGNPGVIDTIDPEPGWYGYAERPTAIARQVVAANTFRDRIRFQTGYSVRAWHSARQDYPDAPEGILAGLALSKDTDLLVVDGDHSYLGAYWDLEVGFRALNPLGPRLILVHDYFGIDTVRQAVRDWCGRHARWIEFRAVTEGCGFALIQCAAELAARDSVATLGPDVRMNFGSSG